VVSIGIVCLGDWILKSWVGCATMGREGGDGRMRMRVKGERERQGRRDEREEGRQQWEEGKGDGRRGREATKGYDIAPQTRKRNQETGLWPGIHDKDTKHETRRDSSRSLSAV
jgi:hypothetical protein